MKIGGHIKWFNKDKGYGYIIGDDDETYFFTLLDGIKLYINIKIPFINLFILFPSIFYFSYFFY